MEKAALFVRPPTDAERQALEDGLRSPAALARRRARIVLASAAGEHSGQIARRLGCTTQEVREVIRAFNARRLDVLHTGSYHPGGAGTSPDPEDACQKARRDHLIRLAQGHPDWRLGLEDEAGRSRLAHPAAQTALDTRQDGDQARPLSDQTVARDASAREAQGVRATTAPRDGLPGPPPRLRHRTLAAAVAAVVLLLVLLAAVTAHVLTTPAHRPAVVPPILSRQPTVASPTSVPAIGWLSVGTVVVLLILLVEKQRVVGIPGGRARKLSRVLTIAILPLLVALAVNVLDEVAASVSQDSSQPAVPSPTSVPARAGAPVAAPQATKPVATPTPVPRRIVPSALQTQPRAPTVLVNPRALRFGTHRLHRASAAQTVYVINLGPTALRITAVAIVGGDAVRDFAQSTGCAGATIPAYDSCTIRVRFRPLTPGSHRASLLIASTAAESPQRVALSGVGALAAPGPGARLLSRTWSPPMPSIRRFTVVHPHPGQPYELVWQTSAATSLTLDGRPVPAHGRVVLPAPLHSVTYRLVARNGARRATADLPVVVDARSTAPHAVVLTTPDIATFAVRRRRGKLYAIWLVRHAVRVQLQGHAVASAGARPVPPGTSWLRLVARNDVGSRQRLLHLARPVPPARPRTRPTRLARPRTRPVPTPRAHPRRMVAARPTATPPARPTRARR